MREKRKKKKKKNFTIGAVTGPQLIKLLKKDRWTYGRKTKHGRCVWKKMEGKRVVTFIPEEKKPLDTGTLSAILGPKQSNIRKKGLYELIKKYGL